jgi:hypothetical protein
MLHRTSTRRSLRPRAAAVVSAASLVSLASVAAVGCGQAAPAEELDQAEGAIHVAESSYVSDAVLASLGTRPDMKGRTWGVSHDNRFEGNWILQTPMRPVWDAPLTTLQVPAACTTNCDADFELALCATQSDCTGGGVCTPVAASVSTPGGTPRSMCVGHSDALVDEIYTLMTRGTKLVDVTSLQPPDGRFEAGIRNALTYLSAKTSPPEVRLLFGAFPVQGVVNTTTVLKSLTRDVPRTSAIKINVGAYRSSNAPSSWNHSKIVAVDGVEAIVGGHNLWTQHYLDKNPVNDLSMHVRGSAAGDAHRFANVLWKYTCDNMSWLTWSTWSVWTNQLDHGTVSSNCPVAYSLPAAEGPSSGTVIAVGRLGSGIQTDGNQADSARIAMMHSAKGTLRMSLQDIGPVKVPYLGIPLAAWPDAEVGEIAAALNRGVDVFVVLSNLNAVAGGLSATQAGYSNGWTRADVHDEPRRVPHRRGAHVAPLHEAPPRASPLRAGRVVAGRRDVRQPRQDALRRRAGLLHRVAERVPGGSPGVRVHRRRLDRDRRVPDALLAERVVARLGGGDLRQRRRDLRPLIGTRFRRPRRGAERRRAAGPTSVQSAPSRAAALARRAEAWDTPGWRSGS